MPQFRKMSLGIAAALTISACGGGGGSEQFSAPGIDTGSVSSQVQLSSTPDGIPEIGAALASAPLNDDFEAVRFLHRTSFGPRDEDIHLLRDAGYANWINQQMQLPASFLMPLTRERSEPRWGEHVTNWLELSVLADDQLRQRVAFALSQLFVVSDQDGLSKHQVALANYYDLLIANSFGNFRDLLEQVTLSPIMGDYLSMKGNQKADTKKNIRPDENFARELLQLFTIGLVQLNSDGTIKRDAEGIPIPTYDQEVVEGFAKVFTGWHFKDVDNWNYPSVKDWFTPMQPYPERHSTGEKLLLNGVILAAGQTIEKDLKDALDNVFNHPNVGPFFSKHMIRQLVTSNPSDHYVERVASVFDADSNGQRGNIAAVVNAVLLDEEALLGYDTNPETFGKLREPLIRMVGLWRAFDANPGHPQFDYGWIANRLSQGPLQSPSVFNFFSPDFSQSGALRDAGLLSPEFQLMNESSIIDITSAMLAHTIWINTNSESDYSNAPIELRQLIELDDDLAAQLNYLSRLTLGQPASDGLLEQANYLVDKRENADAEIRAEELLFLFASSPEAAIQR